VVAVAVQKQQVVVVQVVFIIQLAIHFQLHKLLQSVLVEQVLQ
jgi:hypothetical protein